MNTKCIITILLLQFFVTNSIGQDLSGSLPIFKNANNKYCIKDKNNQVIVLKRNYYDVISYDWGFMVIFNDKFGFINPRGQEIIPPKYKSATFSIYQGLIFIREISYNPPKSIVLDTMGKEVSFAKYYDKIIPFHHNGLLYVSLNGKGGLIDKTGKTITPLYDYFCDNGNIHHLPRHRELLGGTIIDEVCLNHGNDYTPVKLDGKWGFIDTTGKAVTLLKYDSVIVVPVAFGLTKVKYKDTWMYVNAARQEIVRYDTVGVYSANLTSVRKEGKWGFIDIKGKEKIPCKYQEVLSFNEGLVAVKQNNKWGFVDKNGKIIIPIKYDKTEPLFYRGMVGVMLNGKYGFAKLTGQEIVKYDTIVGDRFNEGTLYVKIHDKWGIIDSMGNEITALKYDNIKPIFNGLIKVKVNNKWGIIDKKGKEIIKIKFDDLYVLDKFIVVELDQKYGFFDFNGNETIPVKFDEIGGYENLYEIPQNLLVGKIGNKYGLINESGKEITPIKYEEEVSSFNDLYNKPFYFENNDEFSAVFADNKYGLINSKGKEVIPLKYDWVHVFQEGLALVYRDGKMWFVDTMGIEVIDLKKYNQVHDFYNGLALVKQNNKIGFIDKTGKEVIPLKYDDAAYFLEELTLVKLNNKFGFIDKTGKEVIPLKYVKASYFVEEIAFVELENNKWGCIDKTGKIVVPFKDGNIYVIDNDRVTIRLGENEFYFDWNGNEIKE